MWRYNERKYKWCVHIKALFFNTSYLQSLKEQSIVYGNESFACIYPYDAGAVGNCIKLLLCRFTIECANRFSHSNLLLRTRENNVE